MLISLLCAIVVCAALNFTIEKLAYRPLRNAPRLAPLITAMGMSLLLQTLAMIIWKPNPKPYPLLLPNEPYQPGRAGDQRHAVPDPGRHGGAAGGADVPRQQDQARPCHACHGREPARGGADGRAARHGDLGDLHHRRRAGRGGRRDVGRQLRHRAALDGLPAGAQGLHGRGAGRHRQPRRRGGRRAPAGPGGSAWAPATWARSPAACWAATTPTSSPSSR